MVPSHMALLRASQGHIKRPTRPRHRRDPENSLAHARPPAHRIREYDHRPTLRVVEADETYIGGEEKNKHADKKQGKGRGRGSAGKTPVAGLRERGGKVKASVAPSVSSGTLVPFVAHT